MDLRSIEAFLAVADELHFGRAAAKLHLSTASVSELVRRLEGQLGGPLFVRTTRRVTLTPMGEVFAVEAQKALVQVSHAMSVGRSAAQGGGVPIRLGLALDVAQDLLTRAFEIFRSEHPDQLIVPQSLRTADQIEALLDRRIQIGVAWEPPSHLELVTTTLSSEPFLAMVPRGHPLEGVGSTTPRELAEWPLVMWSRDLNQWTYDRCLSAFLADGVTPNVTYTAWGPDAMVPLISSGLGIGIATNSIVSSKRYVDISYVPIDAVGHECRRQVVSRKDERHPGVRAFTEALLHVAEHSNTDRDLYGDGIG